MLCDYLGNITHQVNTSNVVVAEYNFDACSVKLGFCECSETKTVVELIPMSEADREGRRRSAYDWSYTLDANDLALFADRGFTGHEYLPWFNLYNMNGRMYDPLVGRFLSADTYVQDAGLTQSYNRYSYCLNNPLRYTDPTGEKLKWPKFEWRYLIPIVGQLEYVMQTINDNSTEIRQKMSDAGIPDFGVGVNVGSDGNVNYNGSIYGHEVFNTANIDRSNANQVVSKKLDEVRQIYGDAWMEASYSGGNWETLAIGMTSDFVFAVGPVGISYEIGSFRYKGVDYGISTLGYAIGLDISGGINVLIIRGDPNSFSPYDLRDWSTQFNASYTFISGGYEIPFDRGSSEATTLNTYRTIAPGLSFGLTGYNFGGSMVTGKTRIWVLPSPPSMTDIYKSYYLGH